MRTRINVRIADERGEPFFGDGPLTLLESVAEHGSIRHAAKSMNLSYVKALDILNRMERKLRHKVVSRKIGGSTGGGTQLTPFGRDFLKRYIVFRDKVRTFADKELIRTLGLRHSRRAAKKRSP